MLLTSVGTPLKCPSRVHFRCFFQRRLNTKLIGCLFQHPLFLPPLLPQYLFVLKRSGISLTVLFVFRLFLVVGLVRLSSDDENWPGTLGKVFQLFIYFKAGWLERFDQEINYRKYLCVQRDGLTKKKLVI